MDPNRYLIEVHLDLRFTNDAAQAATYQKLNDEVHQTLAHQGFSHVVKKDGESQDLPTGQYYYIPQQAVAPDQDEAEKIIQDDFRLVLDKVGRSSTQHKDTVDIEVMPYGTYDEQ